MTTAVNDITALQSVILVEIDSTVNVVSVPTPDLSVVEVITVSLPPLVEVVQPSAYLEVIDTIVRGEPGPPGPAGLAKVTHGADPNVARPNVPLVYWVGSVTPVHADPDDLLMLKEA